MRYAALLLLLLASAAQASIIAVMPNASGGHLMLTDLPGKCPKNSWIVMANTELGDAAYGCWTFLDDKVLLYLGNRLFLHDAKNFTPYKPKQPPNQKDKKR